MILYPNCSEIVTKIHARNEEEARDVIEELLAIFNSRLFLDFKAPRYYCEEKKVGDRTILKIYSLYLSDGKIDAEVETYVRERALPRVEFSIEITPRHLCLKNNRFTAGEDFENLCFPTIKFDSYSGKGETFHNVYLDLSSIDAVKPTFMNMEICYDYNDELDAFGDGSIYLMEDEYDLEKYPVIKKILEHLSKTRELSIWGYDGGTLSSFEKWCKINYVDFFLDRKNFPQSGIFVPGAVYLLPVYNIVQLKELLTTLKEKKIKLVSEVYDTRLKDYPAVDISKIESIYDYEKPSLLVNGRSFPLDELSFNYQLYEKEMIDHFQLGYKRSSADSGPTNQFYVFREQDRKNTNSHNLRMIGILKNMAVEIVEFD